jgi:hypothetical protein
MPRAHQRYLPASACRPASVIVSRAFTAIAPPSASPAAAALASAAARWRRCPGGCAQRKATGEPSANDEAKAVIERWSEQLSTSRDMLWSPTIRAALIAGTPWLDVFCPGCGTSRAIDLRKVDRHPLASVAALVLGLRCSWCPGLAPMPKILGLHALPPAAKAVASNL